MKRSVFCAQLLCSTHLFTHSVLLIKLLILSLRVICRPKLINMLTPFQKVAHQTQRALLSNFTRMGYEHANVQLLNRRPSLALQQKQVGKGLFL